MIATECCSESGCYYVYDRASDMTDYMKKKVLNGTGEKLKIIQ